MMIGTRFAIIALAVAGLTSCGPQMKPVVSGHAVDSQRQPKRMLVVQKTTMSVPKPKEKNEFKDVFSRMLAQCGVETAFVVNDITSQRSLYDDRPQLNADIEKDKIARLKPDFTFTLRELSMASSGLNIRDVELDAALEEGTSKKRLVWSGHVSIRMSIINQLTLGDAAAELVGQMRRDGMLRGCPVS